ncbi:similar to Saccharomyces cerevisiae YER040W GLN3 Transcriptional activator of genes regulated by nitrogen catabolite repression (NCR) [Maudiozyma barnettii]|uniref:Similar to Saccharomyces cerevisiae YER040W GLN3 Transcriptional activator of genes regulated by nitrogen catabolite repression (NCR) n=1 Tax=Maudiozyma barnettii TaxID=61262 RepID=A0A8H2VIU6_9SACH|nr:nitrogen-responsive transcriptional regulator GLN3 [Kazachstania barnettii]CAB4256216.1 similar to Saccharomyces cerevisiae YER040W GLN3 Transcriptional activator of genes regulated by nitrogen catabolite repression (NCR) [Kazachstania barnettii]CAD1784824.1 similar to Saccharomyces cerevisiae YER040W GLN3 Transcriptional activator of genes regulated by nitrogen catabolite repression (NCR) [Kazachstania barnettii]
MSELNKNKNNTVKDEDDFHSLFANDTNFENYLNLSSHNNSTTTQIDNSNNNNNNNAFDSMLEVLPDDINFSSFFTPLPTDEDDNLSLVSDRSKNGSTSRATHTPIESTTQSRNPSTQNIQPSPAVKYESIFHQISSQDNNNNNNNNNSNNNSNNSLNQSNMIMTQPIDIANQQNGEIAGLWDFNVDTLQMTPGNSSDSATISAPNSYNSSNLQMSSSHNANSFNQFKNLTSHALTGQKTIATLFQAPGQNVASSSSYSNSNMNSIFNNNNNTNGNHSNSFNIYNIPNGSNNNNNNNMNNLVNSSSPIGLPSSNNSNNIPNNGKSNSNNNSQSMFRQTSRKSSMSQLSTNLVTTDKGISIPLSSTNTSNSIRKNQMQRQMSSTSLTNLNKRPSSISDISTSANNSSILTRKPPVQCFNCKTYKTPLWRRDPNGRTLCNACGLFQKLHGTMRPLSLKSDVIKKRNTKKRTKKTLDAQNQTQGHIDSSMKLDHPSQGPLDIQESIIFEDKQNSIRRNFAPPSISNATATTAMTRTAAQSNMPKATNRGSFTNVNPSGSSSVFNTRMTEEMHTNDPRGYFNQSGMVGRGPSNRIAVSRATSSNDLSQFNNLNSSNNGTAKINRRGSTSSNTSSRSSSSRSMIPILPKPSNSGVGYSNSNNNSNTSSPRVTPNGYPFASNSPIQTGLFSSSAGRNGISIPRRKMSRNASHSSSFMAASLQQLQQQGMNSKQVQHPGNQVQQDSSRIQGSAITPSPMRDEYDMFNHGNNQSIFQRDIVNSQSNLESFPYEVKTDKSHTSLLSQQLSDSSTNTISNADSNNKNAPVHSHGNSEASNTVSTNELDWLKFGL